MCRRLRVGHYQWATFTGRGHCSTCRVGAFGALFLAFASVAACSSSNADQTSAAADGTDDLDLKALVEADDASYHDREVRVSIEVAECMKTKGFEYVVSAPESRTPPSFEESETPTIDRLLWATELASQEEADVDLNQSIFDALPPDKQGEYVSALEGTGDISDMDDVDVEELGCYNGAWVVLYGEDAVRARHQLADAVAELDTAVYSDQDVQDAAKGFESCMSDVGYNISVTEPVAPIERAFEAAVRAAGDVANADLSEARQLERELKPKLEECSKNVKEVERRVRKKLQPQYIDPIADSVALVQADVRGDG